MVGFTLAARAILDVRLSEDQIHWPVLYTNIGFAYEHSFKAVLSAGGWSDDQLRDRIGHKLKAGLHEAVRLGFQPHSSDVWSEIEILSPIHHKHVARYLPEAEVDLPISFDDSCRLLWDHSQTVGRFLGLGLKN
jgi:hypothetical protein